MRQGAIGDGFDKIDRVLEFWPHLDNIDLFCFPDCGNSGLQLHLESLGKAVWGSRRGDRLELGREYFMERLGDVGLSVPKFEVVIGLDALREHLKDREDVYVKVSRWRGDFETFHWRTWKMDQEWLDWLGVNFGPVEKLIHFLVFDAIDTDLEIGGDTYCVDGGWPALMLNGVEGKDKTYFSAVTKREAMPEQIQEIFNAMSDELRNTRYRNQISFEDRVVGDEHFYIDATQRGGMPSSCSQYKLWKNFPQIVWSGANGELIDPDPGAMFSIECQITCKCEKDVWVTVELPEELVEHCNFSYCGYLDGCYIFPPDDIHQGELGWFNVTGDDPSGLLQNAKDLADMLPDGLNADVESLAAVISEIDKMKRDGIPFTEKEMPEPAEVL